MKKKLIVSMTAKEFMAMNEGLFQMECMKVSFNGKKMKKTDKLSLEFEQEEKLQSEKIPEENLKPKGSEDSDQDDNGGMFA